MKMFPKVRISAQAGLLLALAAVSSAGEVPVVHAPWGSVSGVQVSGDGGRVTHAYLGLPYALPPTGDRRFLRPLPHPGPGEGKVFTAHTEMPACWQNKPGIIVESRERSEDCLQLNVYVPAKARDPGALLPVMFWIHGGALITGDSAFYRPSRLVADHDVIVVTIQYRLNVFGFLSTGDDVIKGNQGFWDQNLALKWVFYNIEAFGGSPAQITVFGESAGSWSTGVQLMSPVSRGLFSRVILQSGAPQSFVAMDDLFDVKDAFKLTAAEFGCESEDVEAAVACLQQVDAEEFFNKTLALGEQAPGDTFYVPLIDNDFIVGDPLDLIKDEDFVKEHGIDEVDVMIGVNQREGAMALYMVEVYGMDPSTLQEPSFFRQVLDYGLSFQGLKADDTLRKTAEFFYRGDAAGSNETMSIELVADMMGDSIMHAPIFQWAQAMADSPYVEDPLFYELEHNFTFNKGKLYQGSYHGDDLPLTFDNERELDDDFMMAKFYKPGLSDEEKTLADDFVTMLASFAKTGVPSGPLVNKAGGWPRFTSKDQSYLTISLTPTVTKDLGPYKARAALWNNLLPQLNQDAKDKEEGKTAQAEVKDEL